ncbi:uncharacterized protein LOC135127312 [Zophobas morio]|uniref:uncharacterized protein LOC135127312 n=1 Tax=Zophobas morio TaxID=2755281 RepID=UPI003082CC06
MKSSKAKKNKSKSSKKIKLNETSPNAIKEKPYITKEIDTSITLLESPEGNLVLEALLFLSKYADIQRNNLESVQTRGLLPKLLALLDHNICIVRVSLRLLSQLLTVEAAQLELNQEKVDEAVMKICGFYINHSDVNVKEFSSQILATYSTLGKAHFLVTEPRLITAILKTIKIPETDVILRQSLELLSKFIEMESVRKRLPEEKEFNITILLEKMQTSENCFPIILEIFEKMTYFCDDTLQTRLKECNLVEHIFDIITDPERIDYVVTCLKIVLHCMGNENTKSYFTSSFEFLKFCQWIKTCPDHVMQICADIFLEISKIDSIKQMLFDLSIEDIILSFFRSSDKQVLNTTCDAVNFMAKHKYCCEKMVTPVVIKKLLEIMRRVGDSEDPENEVALSTLHYFSRRDSRTIYMIRTYDGIEVLLKYLKERSDKLSTDSYKKVLEIINMFVTNNQLQSLILSPDLYEVILTQTSSKFDEICMRSLEIMINCLNHEDFQNYFLLNKGSQVVADKLSSTTNEQVVRLLIIFIHNALMYENLARDLIYKKILLILKRLPEGVKYRNPLIQTTINLIYNMCLPVKFYETGRLEFTDRLNERFYVINGPWNEPFPFLEVLELRRMSTLSTIYVVDECEHNEQKCFDCISIHTQNMPSISANYSFSTISSVSSYQTRCTINFGLLSHDPYLPKYVEQIKNLVTNVTDFEKKIQILAKFVDTCLCGPEKNSTNRDKQHTFKLHIACIKQKLGTNMIPIGYLRLGFQCERALLFKALADHVDVRVSLVKGKNKMYWNEVALIQTVDRKTALKMFVVDLMSNIGQLLPVGSRECNMYCDIQ